MVLDSSRYGSTKCMEQTDYWVFWTGRMWIINFLAELQSQHPVLVITLRLRARYNGQEVRKFRKHALKFKNQSSQIFSGQNDLVKNTTTENFKPVFRLQTNPRSPGSRARVKSNQHCRQIASPGQHIDQIHGFEVLSLATFMNDDRTVALRATFPVSSSLRMAIHLFWDGLYDKSDQVRRFLVLFLINE